MRITAVRKVAAAALVVEAGDNGLLARELAAGITCVKGAKSKGVRVGNWLSVRQAQRLLNAPDVSIKKRLRVGDFLFRNRFASRAAAIKWLLDWALSQKPTPRADEPS